MAPRIRLNPFKKKPEPPPPPPTTLEVFQSHVSAAAPAVGLATMVTLPVLGLVYFLKKKPAAKKAAAKPPRTPVTPDSNDEASPAKPPPPISASPAVAAAVKEKALATPESARPPMEHRESLLGTSPLLAEDKTPTKEEIEAAQAAALAALATSTSSPASPLTGARFSETLEADRPAGGGWRISNFEMQGRRKSMEDAHVTAPKAPLGDVLGILDGCGGSNASTCCAAEFAKALGAATGDPAKALAAAFARVEAKCLADATANKWLDATTATIALVSDARVDVAWVGDSRAVLASRGPKKLKAEALVRDHRPEGKAEMARIKALGGGCGRNEKEAFATAMQLKRAKAVGAHVVFNVNRKSAWRVFPGGIAVTRALGARPLKARKPPLVIATPELATRKLDGSEKFLVVACDGVWDVMSDLQACEVVQAAIASAGKLGAESPAEHLVKQAYAMGSDDNISAVVLEFVKE